jgi:AraC-like DNA-binding protein
VTAEGRALHQSFLPTQGSVRAYVWKYTPVNWGRRPRHFHAEPELNLIASGSATFGVGERLVRVCQGDILGFQPAQDHILLEASPDLYLFAIGMTRAFSAEVLRRQPDHTMVPLQMRLADEDFRALVEKAAAIVDRDGVDQSCAELWERMHCIRQRGESRNAAATHVLTRWALSALSDAPSLGLQRLSENKGTSASEVSRYFHRDLGMTFVQYRTRLRLLRFIGLMDTGGKSLMSAAEESGFGSYSQCHRIFQAELGCSPRQFFFSDLRQQMQQAYDP